MVNETIDGSFRQTNLPGESSDYLAKREELRLAEVELMRPSRTMCSKKVQRTWMTVTPRFERFAGASCLSGPIGRS